MRRKITPFLWYDGQAREAAAFYTSIFKDSEIISSNPLTTTFRIENQTLVALNGGPAFKFTEAASLMVDCKDQEEVDYYWEKLIEGGQASRCGWLKDKYGLSWQIVPEGLPEMLMDPDREKANRTMQAMLAMSKLDIEALKRAHDGDAG